MTNEKPKKSQMSRHNPNLPKGRGLPVTEDMNIRMDGQTEICGANAKSTGLPCKRIPMANGRCQVHGGKNTAPKDLSKHWGNSNAVTHGAYQHIWFDTLDEQEQEIVPHINTEVIKQIDDQLKILAIRERRMMMRIQKANQEHAEYVIRAVDMVYGKKPKPEDAEYDEYTGEIVRVPIAATEYMESKIEFIQRIEAELTKLSDKKTKLLDLKHKVESGNGDTGKVDVSVYVDALGKSAKDVWSDKEDTKEE